MIEPSAMFPVLVSENLAELKNFYTTHFGFQAVFYDAEFYLHLLHPGSGAQLGFLVPDHPSQPESLHPAAASDGMVISFEVADAGAAFAAAGEMRLPVVMDLKQESWGQTHFMVRDPGGFVIDVVEHVETD